MPDFWFTSDHHFGHNNIIKYCNRPFETVEEMNETMIENWNSLVKKNDIVYHLGDFTMNSDPMPYISRLKGKVHLILGNHDKQAHRAARYWQWTKTTSIVKLVDHTITLCHYPMLTWLKSCYNEWSLFGHVHGRIDGVGKSLDVGVDCNDFSPVNLDTISEKMKNRDNNVDFIGD